MTEPNDSMPLMARPRVAAGLLIRDAEGRILLVKPTYKEGWDIPGGYVEPGESPAQAAGREVIEELGVHVPVGRLLVVDWAPHPAEGDKLLFVFDGGTRMATWLEELRLQVDEIAEARFVFLSEVGGLLPERLHRRLSVAGDIESAAATYAEHGRAVAPSAS